MGDEIIRGTAFDLRQVDNLADDDDDEDDDEVKYYEGENEGENENDETLSMRRNGIISNKDASEEQEKNDNQEPEPRAFE